MRKRWIILVLILAAGGYWIYSGTQGTFGDSYARLAGIENRHQVGDELLVPGDTGSLDELEQELRSFKNSLNAGLPLIGNPDAEALALLADSRLELVEMERNILAVRQLTREPGFPDCGTGGNVAVAVQLLDQAAEHSEAAGEARNRAGQNYSVQTLALSSNNTVFQESVEAQLASIRDLRNVIENRCT